MLRICSIIALFAALGLVACRGEESTSKRQSAGDGLIPRASLSYQNPIKGILDQSCATCHSLTPSGGASAAFTLASYDDVGPVLGVRSMLERIKERVRSQTMPPDPSMLDAAARANIINWIERGAPKKDLFDAIPTARFLSATTANEIADTTYDIKVSFADFDSSATWTVYYSLTPGATSGGTPIASDQAISVTRLAWDTTDLAPGTYSLYLVAQDDDVTINATATGSVRVAHATTTKLTYYTDIKPILTSACGTCHGATPTSGAPATLDLTSYENVGSVQGVKAMTARIKARVADGTMPPVGSPLTAAQKNKILSWIESGANAGTAPESSSTASMFLVAPRLTNQAASSQYTVQALFFSVEAGATWDLYYTPTLGDTSGGTAIQLGLSTAVTDVTWNLTAVPAGNYYIYSVLHSGGTSTTVSAYGSVLVSHPVTMSFVAPASSNGTADTTYAAQLSFTGAGTGATWSLYRSSTAGATTGGTLISGGLPLSTTTVNWDTTALTAGLYYLYAIASDRGTSTALASTSGVSVSHPGPANQSPTLSLTSPNGAQTLFAGTTATVSYTASDPDGDTLTYLIELSSDGGASYTTLASGVTTSSYAWAIAGNQTEAITYRIRVTASDGNGGTATDASDASFGIAAAALTFSGVIQPILNGDCTPCHTSGGAQNGQFIYSDYQNGTTTGSYDLRDRIRIRTADDSMPPGMPKLTSGDKVKLQLWIWDGAAP